MKNIHLLPTDKPSRIISSGKEFTLLKNTTIDKRCKNIYITSDEEIGTDEYYFHLKNNEYYNSGRIEELDKDMKFWKKIILTTDQDLIKSGVQAIDDEFLEWFVKNPSCEEVEVKRNKKLSNKSIWDAVEGDLVFNNHNCGGIITQLSDDVRVHIISENGEGYMETAITSDNGLDTLVINNYKVYEYSGYKIIIPKEEPKQETLEEAAKDYIENTMRFSFNSMETKTQANRMLKCVEFGAKWQAEQDKNKYSEEEVVSFIHKFIKEHQPQLPYLIGGINMWFKHFKKK